MTKSRKTEMNFWAMVNSVLIHSTNKGQLPAMALALIGIIMALKMPPERIADQSDRIFRGLAKMAGASYTLNVVLIVGGAAGYRKLRVRFTDELTRIGKEKSDLQEQIIGHKLSSSKRNHPQE